MSGLKFLLIYAKYSTILNKMFDDLMWRTLNTLKEEEILARCLALYCYDFLENIGFVYPTMSMIVIGPSLLY
jgi:hypothetical protein